MPVALIFTGFTSHPKIRRAGEQAGWMFVHCLEYAAEWHTDGFIPAEAIDFGLKNHRQRLARLLHGDERFGPLLHKVDGGYEINDYLEWNRRARELAEAAREKSEVRAKAGRKGAEARWGGRLQDGNGHGKPDGKPMANGMAEAMADPVANRWQPDGSGSGSGSKNSPPVVDLVPNGTARDIKHQDQTGGDDPPEVIVRARRRAQAPWPDHAWSMANCRNVVERSTKLEGKSGRLDAGLRQEAWDRLAVLAALDSTRSPGRLLEPAGWELAGRELARIRTEQGNRRVETAEREARQQGAVGCEHGHPLGGRHCAMCRHEIPAEPEPQEVTR